MRAISLAYRSSPTKSAKPLPYVPPADMLAVLDAPSLGFALSD